MTFVVNWHFVNKLSCIKLNIRVRKAGLILQIHVSFNVSLLNGSTQLLPQLY